MKRSYPFLLALLLIAIMASLVFFFMPQKTAETKTAVLDNIGVEHYAAAFKVQVQINPEQPRVGKNQVTIIIRDKDNQPVSQASIQAVAEMPAMGSMPTMYAPATITMNSEGSYHGEFELPMMGAWPLTLKINTPTQGQAQLSFDMSTSRKGLALSFATPSPFAPKTAQSTNNALTAQSFKVDAYRRQLIGVTTDEVICMDMKKTITVRAKINYDQTRLTEVSLKFDGWIDQLKADYVGKQVKKGQTLFTVYSPELVSSQEEYLHSYKRSLTGQSSLKAAAAQRLSLWGINRAQIRRLEKRGRALENLPIPSPITGTVIEKNIVAGAAFKASTKLLGIADLSQVWVEGQVYAADLPLIELGMTATVIINNKTDKAYTGKVTFIEPFLDNASRTARIRVELANPDGLLRPDQYVQLQLNIDLGRRIVVPEQAVIFTGEKRVVFVDLGEGRLQAQQVTTGVRNKDFIEVVDGLDYGDIVVSSGNFLIAAESKLKMGNDAW